MPYSNVPKNLWGKMDRCTEQVTGKNKRTGKPYTKAQKVAICYSRVVGTSGENAVVGEDFGDFVLDPDNDGIITVVAAEDGSPVYMRMADGDVIMVTWRPGTLRKIAGTWVGTKVGINHYHDTELDGTVVAATVSDIDNDLKDELVLRIKIESNMKAILDRLMPDVFTSVEAVVKELSGTEIVDAIGMGNTFVVTPSVPACSPDNCYVVGYKMGEIMDNPDEDEGCCGGTIEYELDDDDFAAELWRQEGPYWDSGLEASGVALGAKLTAKTRNALPDSAFCGPGRSFPAHDAAHARNGLARLKNSNFGPAAKAKIHACLVRRAKKHGVEVSGAEAAYHGDMEGGLEGCLRVHLEEATACLRAHDVDIESAGFNASGKKGGLSWYTTMSYSKEKPSEAKSVGATNTATGNIIFASTSGTPGNTSATIAADSSFISIPSDGSGTGWEWTVMPSPDGNHEPPSEANMTEDNATVIAEMKAKLDALEAEKAALLAGNQKPPSEGTLMSDEQTIVALRAQLEAAQKERDDLAKFREDRLKQERYSELLALKKMDVDVKEFEQFSLEQLRVIASGVKSGKTSHSGAQATKPRDDLIIPAASGEVNLARFVAGSDEPDLTPEQIAALKAYKAALLGMGPLENKPA